MTVESFFVRVEIIDVFTVILDVVNDAKLNHFGKIILKYFVEWGDITYRRYIVPVLDIGGVFYSTGMVGPE